MPALLEAAESAGDLGEAARESLAELPGGAVDQAILEQLPRAAGRSRALLIQIAGERAIAAAAPALLQDAESTDEAVRLAALGALGPTAGFDQLDSLIQRLVDPGNDAEAEAAKTALVLACTRMHDRDATAAKLSAAVPRAPVRAQVALVELLGAVAGEKAVAGIAAAARAGDDQVQDAATRVLGEWLTADAAPALLELAQSGSPKYRVRALRGYIRIARQLKVPVEQCVAMCKTALPLCRRDDERKLVLEALRRYPAPDGLALAVAQLDRGQLKQETAETVVAIAEKLLPSHPAVAAAALQKVVEAGVDAKLADRAKGLLNQAPAPPAQP